MTLISRFDQFPWAFPLGHLSHIDSNQAIVHPQAVHNRFPLIIGWHNLSARYRGKFPDYNTSAKTLTLPHYLVHITLLILASS